VPAKIVRRSSLRNSSPSFFDATVLVVYLRRPCLSRGAFGSMNWTITEPLGRLWTRP
jgi:hypothetical protein